MRVANIVFAACVVSASFILPANALTRGEAVNACKAELHGAGRTRSTALPTCVAAKLDAARAAGKTAQRTGQRCRYSTLATTC